ncbi:MAG: hypothetical protein LBR74_04635 [Eubacterium sp.]|jgi:hypothetical protein|nr:hypothetical protein [Eubacterium sp.]
MAGIPQITNPLGGGKGYATGNLSQKGSGESERFEIIQIENPLVTEQSGERPAGGRADLMTGQKGFLPMTVKIAKDPTLAVEAMRQIVNEDLLTVAKVNGYTELYGELDSMMKSLFITPDKLLTEITSQERDNTMFSGNGFFDILRNIAAEAKLSGNEDLESAIGNILKAVNFAQNKDEILSALSFNMKFLSGYFAPNKGLSTDLGELAKQWGAPQAGDNFANLKDETLFILKNVSESLLNNDRTQVLIPLIIHNLSRYNTNKNMLLEYFNNLITVIPDRVTKSILAGEFDKLLEQLFPQANRQALGGQAAGQDTANTAGIANTPNFNNAESLTGFANTNTPADSQNPISGNAQTAQTNNNVSANNEANQFQNNNNNNINNNTTENQTQENTQAAPTTQTPQKEGVTARHSGDIINTFKEDIDSFGQPVQNQTFPETQAVASQKNSAAALWGEFDQNEFTGNSDIINQEVLDSAVRGFLLGKNDGKTAISDILKNMINLSGSEQLKVGIDSEMTQIEDIDSLIVYLNDVLKAMPEVDIRQNIYESFLEIINKMVENDELPMSEKPFPELAEGRSTEQAANHRSGGNETQAAEKSSSLNELIGFIEKNIDHPALKTVNNYNASNLLQSLINAPGVFTPLSHYIIPVEFNETRAFGELWVNNDEENTADSEPGKRTYHLFLTFDIDSIGRFEIDLRSSGEDVNISLLHPESFSDNIGDIVNKVGRIIAGSGYVTRSFVTGPLIKPHNLTEVFPSILEKREGFNVTA